MNDAYEKIDEMMTVIKATNGGDLSNPVLYWARRGVIAEALANTSYLKRRVAFIYLKRHSVGNFTENKVLIKSAIDYIRKLAPVAEAVAILKVNHG